MNNNTQIKLDFPMLESLDFKSTLKSFIAEKERLATIKPSKNNNVSNKGLTLDKAKAKLEGDNVEYSNINKHFVTAVKNRCTLCYKFTDAGSIEHPVKTTTQRKAHEIHTAYYNIYMKENKTAESLIHRFQVYWATAIDVGQNSDLNKPQQTEPAAHM
ncbi:hypothetical protein HDU79_010169, partial [Rhizoclosmatium sp. JEL0117]